MSRGPFGGGLPPRRDGAAGLLSRVGGLVPFTAIAAAALVLLIVVILLASRCGGGGTAQAADCNKKPPAPPAGLAYASKFCAPAAAYVGKRGTIRAPLTDRGNGRGLSLYAYDNGKWTRLASADVTQDGAYAVDTQVVDVPKAFAVLRRAGGGFQVYGAVPAGGQPSAEAAGLITELVPAVYKPLPDGSLTGGPSPVLAGVSYGVVPSVSAESGTEVQTVNSILADAARLNAHADRIAAEVERGNYDGIEIDYTAVDASYKKNFTTFVQALAQRLHGSKRQLLLRLPLPRRDGDVWNTSAYDWTEIAKAADTIVIAPEYDQSLYRTRVPDALKYVVSQVGDPGKLILGITPLSEERSEQGTVRTLTTLEALSIAGQITVNPDDLVTGNDVPVTAENINRDSAGGLQWTPQAVLTFQYRAGDEQRTVWVEDQFSAAFKLAYAQLNRLGGVEIENATGDPAIADVWPAVADYQAAGAPTLVQPNPQALRPQWLADGKAIADAGNRASITWHAPDQAGRHTLTVIVGDGTIRVANTITVDVRVGTPGTPGPARAPGASATRTSPTSTRSAPAPTRTSTSGR